MKTDKPIEIKTVIGLPTDEMQKINRLLDGPATDCGRDECFYEKEVQFAGGITMLLQAIACSEPVEGGWTQGVLLEERGGLMHEVGCTDVGEDFDGEYSVDYDGVRYTVEVVSVHRA